MKQPVKQVIAKIDSDEFTLWLEHFKTNPPLEFRLDHLITYLGGKPPWLKRKKKRQKGVDAEALLAWAKSFEPYVNK